MRALALGAALLGGCSFLFVPRVPSSVDRRRPPTCSTAVAAPIVDALMAASAVAALSNPRCGGEECPTLTLVTAGALLAGFALSTVHGFHQTHRCRQQIELLFSQTPPPSPAWLPGEGGTCALGSYCSAGMTCRDGFCARTPR
jgi:hypothetical protein